MNPSYLYHAFGVRHQECTKTEYKGNYIYNEELWHIKKNNCKTVSVRFGKLKFHLKSSISMRYDISKPTAPAMPNLGWGTECVKLLLSQASKDMFEPLIPMFFPILGANTSETKFQQPGHKWKKYAAKWPIQTLIRINSDFDSPHIIVYFGGF